MLMYLLQDLIYAVPLEVLPPKWGGTSRKSASAGGVQGERTGICMGGKVPLYYQSVNQLEEIPGQYRLQK